MLKNIKHFLVVIEAGTPPLTREWDHREHLQDQTTDNDVQEDYTNNHEDHEGLPTNVINRTRQARTFRDNQQNRQTFASYFTWKWSRQVKKNIKTDIQDTNPDYRLKKITMTTVISTDVRPRLARTTLYHSTHVQLDLHISGYDR